MEEVPNELRRLLGRSVAEIADEYLRIRGRAREDPGTAGDEGEADWASVLRRWLPSTYHVVTKGRLLTAQGKLSPQMDVFILSPSYPPALLDKKVVLADGVVAAFECKLTLTARDVAAAVRTAQVAKTMITSQRRGTPFRDLHAPPIVGLLAHSHVWKGATSNPVRNVTRALTKADERHVRHPAHMLDVTCIADLGTWTAEKEALFMGEDSGDLGAWQEFKAALGLSDEGGVVTYVRQPHRREGEADPRQASVGTMLAWLYYRLAWDDVTLRPLAHYLAYAGVSHPGSAHTRAWPLSVFSPRVLEAVRTGRFNSEGRWNEWSSTW